MGLGRRSLIGGTLAIAGVAAGCTPGLGRPGCTPTPTPTPMRTAFGEPGSIQRALAEVIEQVGDLPLYLLRITPESLEVAFDGVWATWQDGQVSSTVGPPPSGGVPLDLTAIDYPTWPQLAERAGVGSSVLTLDRVEVANVDTWGWPAAVMHLLDAHAAWQRQFETTFEPVVELRFSDDHDYDTGLRELVGLGGVEKVSTFFVHHSTMGVQVPWQSRYGGSSVDPGVSIHRTRAGRNSYRLVSKDTPPPTPQNLFPLSAVRRDIIRKGAAELQAPQDAWKATVQLGSGRLVYQIGGAGADRAVYDAEGHRIG